MIEFTDPNDITPEMQKRLDKYGSTLDRQNIELLIERIADYPEIIETVGKMRVEPDEIIRQRELGWPDFHPEDFCHRCGAKNPSWYASADSWIEATSGWAKQTGREGICCPLCFLELYEETTGERGFLHVTPVRARRG